MMEISNETKAKVFAQYLGQRVCTINSCSNCTHKTIKYIGKADYKLILKPLNKISDEDIIVTAGLKYKIGEDYLKYSLELTKKDISNLSLILSQFQYLQSKGYDLPHYLLNGKTLHESGLAIYE